MDQAEKSYTLLLFTLYWPVLSHMTTPKCKGCWEIQSSFEESMTLLVCYDHLIILRYFF